VTRGVDDLLTDLAEAIDAAAELVDLGKERWDAERPLRLAGEAVIGRLGDVATKLPDEVVKATPEIPWREVKGLRIIAAHAYHRIDYETVWVTLRDDVPRIWLGDLAMAAFANLIVPNTCQNAASNDCAHGSLPSSEQMEQPVGELDS
jgi:uncharacterized protein with HEPN domain